MGTDTATWHHVAELDAWEQARRTGRYPWSTRGRTVAEEGFLHASYAADVAGTLARFYADAPGPLVLLVVDPRRVHDRVEVENGFPHLFGELPLDAVVDVVPLARDATGAWVSPVG